MTLPVLVTKLYVPPPGLRVIPRPRLIERLNEGLRRKLTLISAPAGFGKTTLVSEWIATSGRPTAWLSLDEADSDPQRFLTYLIAALQTVVSTIGEGVVGALQLPQLPPIESILTTLLNEIATLPHPLVLVLDDYHVIDSGPIDLALTFLLDHLPPRLHVAITTREDPHLPLARLRTRGQLVEVRAADLRFTAGEAAEFFNPMMGLNLSSADITALENRTEGWIAGLQLAALSMEGRTDVSGFIQTFAGDDRYIVDYLVEEVLGRQSESIRTFLLQTSILDRLSGPLCDAITGRIDGKTLLDTLERGNLFVVPLDDKRLWYRYHHLFAEVLRAHAMTEQPDDVALWHRRASAWYERNGSWSEAVHHALAAADFARAADVLERALPLVRRDRHEVTFLGWLRKLPGDVLRCRPVLSAAFAGVLLSCGESEGVEDCLRDAERWLNSAERPVSSTEMVVADEDEFRRLPGVIAVYRSGSALARGDVAATVHHAQQALELVAEGDHVWRGAASALMGLASWTSGELEAAYRSYADGMASLQRGGFIVDAIGGAIAPADIRITQGRLTAAQRIYEQSLQLAIEQGPPDPRGTADMYVGLAQIHYERNDLQTATHLLQRSIDLGESAGFPQNPYRWRVAMAHILVAQGDLNGALDLLHEAERRYVSDMYPNVRPIAALKTRVWVAQGRLDEALGWAHERNLHASDTLSYLREYEHLTLARVLIALSTRERTGLQETFDFLERLLNAAEAGKRTGSVIETLVLIALAHGSRGDVSCALAPLERALILAEPEGYVRAFVGEGETMARLVAEAAARMIMPNYTGSLLAAFDIVPTRDVHTPRLPAKRAQPLVEPLSPRELEVLQLIAQGLSNHDIAERLFLALSTVKGHNRVIFEKLQVQRRTEAVARAREFGLV